MIALVAIFFLAPGINGLKIWLFNTDVNNKLNWDILDTPKTCDYIRFQMENDVAAFWNLKGLVISGWSLPKTGDIIFPQNTIIQFRDKEKCSQMRDLKYIRNKVKGWLDPYNWKSNSKFQWLPHLERVPCAGESVLFPPKQTFAVQLPSILLPLKDITFDNEVFDGETWTEFLKTDLGYRLFKGPDDLRKLPWRFGEEDCIGKKSCVCARSSYTIRDRVYREVSPRTFQEAVCLYAMPKCEVSDCYFPVVPEGHCCGICGAIIKLEDKSEEGLNINNFEKLVDTELMRHGYEKNLKVYVGRTLDENIQIVIVAENSVDTIKSHVVANLLKTKFIDKHFSAVSSHLSGLTLKNYFFNSISGIVFGTLFCILIFFFGVFYFYVIFPKKKFQHLNKVNPFTFARFDNTLQEATSEENLQLGIEPEIHEELPQAFDNPLYTENLKPSTSKQGSNGDLSLNVTCGKNILENSSTKEFSNPVYEESERSEKLDTLVATEGDSIDEDYKEIKL